MVNGFASASFELILFDLLHRRGWAIEVEPAKAGTAKRPDFLATRDGVSFYTEAVLATEMGPEDVGGSKRFAELHDLLNTIDSPNFFVGIEVESVGPGQPSARDIRSFLDTKLAALDPDDDSIWIDKDGEYTPPAWSWQDGGWSLVFRPHPKREEARGKPGSRPVGAIDPGVRQLNTIQAIRSSIKRKAGRYGEMDRPYMIAVNVRSWHMDDVDMVDALMGDVVYTAQETTAGIRTGHERMRNGIWRGPDGPRNRRVSAILYFEDVDPWNVAQRHAWIVHNPWAIHPLLPGVFGVAEWSWPDARTRQKTEGERLHRLLGLAPDWPAGDDDGVDLG